MRVIKFSLISSLILSNLVSSEIELFKDAQVDGNIRGIYDSIKDDNRDKYVTSLGVGLNIKSKKVAGFSTTIGFRSSKDISGNNKKNEYTVLDTAYIEYSYKNLLLSGGRKIIDTPLADSDDIRMIPNSFEVYRAILEFENIHFIAGYFNKWQGNDSGLESTWSKTGDSVYLATTFSNSTIDSSLWFYNISNGDNASVNIYTDITSRFIEIDDILSLNISGQYLLQREKKKSDIKADIYGLMAEINTHNITLTLAYNNSTKHNNKHSFSGFGGGALFTNMDSMILDEITADIDANALVSSISYEYKSFNFTYMYGDFSNNKTDIVEQNIVAEYLANDNLVFNLSYITNKEIYDIKNLRFFTSYSF